MSLVITVRVRHIPCRSIARLLAIASLTFFSTRVFAQAPGEVAPLPQPAQPAQQTEPIEELKSPATAVTISVGTTLAGVVALSATSNSALGLGGLGLVFIGPSTGRWYSGHVGGGSLALRGLGGVSMIVGLAKLFAEDDFDCLGYTDAECQAATKQHERNGDEAAVLLIGGMATWVGTSIYDMIMAGHEANVYNREHALHLAPMVSTSSGHRTTGLVLEGRF